MTPYLPKRPCPVCRRLDCTRHAHERQPVQYSGKRRQRPEYRTEEQIRRRRDTVAAWLEVHGRTCASGDVIARCPDCGEMRARFVADHVTPLALGGSEDGPLRVQCARCSAKQGRSVANKVKGRPRPA